MKLNLNHFHDIFVFNNSGWINIIRQKIVSIFLKQKIIQLKDILCDYIYFSLLINSGKKQRRI